MAEKEKKKVNLGKKPDVEVFIYLDVTDPENPFVLPSELESKIDPSNLPENVVKLTSTWAKPNILLTNIIELNSYIDRALGGQVQRVFDQTMKTMAQIKVLLKGWNLDLVIGPEYKLAFEPSMDDPKVMLLSRASLDIINNLQPSDIINAMFLKAFKELYFVKDTELAKKLREKKDEKSS